MSTFGVIGIILAVIFIWAIAIYNRFISNKQKLEEGASGIDVQLKRRNDLIPNLLESVKGYMTHEKETLEQVTKFRTESENAAGGNIEDRAKAEKQLSGALANFFAVAENYPDLKASTNFVELQNSLRDVEEQIQLARRYYNGTARDFNTSVQTFPNNIIASIFGFKISEFFEIENAAEKNVPQVKF